MILSQNREGMGTDDIFDSGSQSSSAVAGSILPSPYSSCSKVKTFKGNTRREKNLACIFYHKALALVCFSSLHKWEAVRSEQTFCRKGGRRKEGGGRSKASGRSGRQSGKTTVVSCRWVLVPFPQL